MDNDLVKGGQGRSGESVRVSALTMAGMFLAAACLCVLASCKASVRTPNADAAGNELSKFIK